MDAEEHYITIPFRQDFSESMLTGQKTCTSRTKRYGREGDRFKAFGTIFQLRMVERRTLTYVAAALYRAEGCQSAAGFLNTWVELHPRKGWVPEQRVWVHHFTRVLIGRTMLDDC